MTLPLRLDEPRALPFKDRSLFCDKLTAHDEHRFGGLKGGFSWKGKVERRFFFSVPILKNIAEWVKQEELETITIQKFQEAVGLALTREQIHAVDAAMWGFLSGGILGPAEEIFKRADTLNGLDEWTRMTR